MSAIKADELRKLWQPIETAPKDGTPVLLCGGRDDNAKYAPDLNRLTSAPCRAAWNSDGWVMTVAEAGCVRVDYENPTRWMPLPEPPDVVRVLFV